MLNFISDKTVPDRFPGLARFTFSLDRGLPEWPYFHIHWPIFKKRGKDLENTSDLQPRMDWMVTLVEWMKDYCEYLHDEITRKKRRIDSEYTQHLINQWAESTLIFVAQSNRLPCPSCKESIPLRLDTKIVKNIVMSVVRDYKTAKRADIDIIRNKIEETAGEHQIPCSDHNKNCPFSHKGWITLTELIPEMCIGNPAER